MPHIWEKDFYSSSPEEKEVTRYAVESFAPEMQQRICARCFIRMHALDI